MNAREIVASLGGTASVVAATEVDRSAVVRWRLRDSIPARHWTALLRIAATKPGCGVTADVLAAHASSAKDAA